MTRKLWFDIFIRVAVIFVCTLIIILIANSTLLYRYFLFQEKHNLCQQAQKISDIDVGNPTAVVETLSDIKEKYSIDIEIYSENNTILYTTQGEKLMSFVHGQPGSIFSPRRRPFVATGKREVRDGYVLQTGKEAVGGEEFLYCSAVLNGTNTAELSVRLELIENSAAVAGQLTSFVTAVCFVLAIGWCLLFARKFSRPIAEMTEITSALAGNNFDRRVPVTQKNEIGQLGASINHMAVSLKQTMDELTAANIRLQKEVENERRLDKMRKQFVANVSHELKTPIAIISGYAEGLGEALDDEKRREYCNVILDESKRMNSLVLSILELSRYESGQIPINKSPFPVLPVLEGQAQRIFANRAVEVTLEIAPDLWLFADETLFEQATKSYLENAKSHTPDGGRIVISAENKGDRVRLSVFNEGQQIEEEKLPLIWQSFYRGETSHKRDSARFGLGLSIVSAIAELHGMEKGVYNTEAGVCFWIEFEAGRRVDYGNAYEICSRK